MIWELWLVAALFVMVSFIGLSNVGLRMTCRDALNKFIYAADKLPEEQETINNDVIPVAEEWRIETYQVNVILMVVQVVNALLVMVAITGDLLPIAPAIKIFAAIGNAYAIMVFVTAVGRHGTLDAEVTHLGELLTEKQVEDAAKDDK